MNYTKFREIKKLYFGYEELSKALNITLASARVSATRWVKKGFLVKIKRNLYVLKEKWDVLENEGKFILANLIQVPSYISLMTAMGYFEITTQVQRDFVESICIHRTKEVEIEKTIFNYTKIDEKLYFDFSREREFFIATPEKAFLDALYLMSIKRYSFDLTSIDFAKLDVARIKTIVKRFPRRTQELLGRYEYFKKA